MSKPVPEQAPGAPATDRLRGMKVLLVEDSPDNQMLVKILLSKFGVDLTIAENGREGCTAAHAEDFKVVLMDLQMPMMDGFTAVRALRAVIALTAHAMSEEKQRCLEAGFTDFLGKPILARSLIEMLLRFA